MFIKDISKAILFMLYHSVFKQCSFKLCEGGRAYNRIHLSVLRARDLSMGIRPLNY